jgi:hypothetical protein
VTDLLQVLSLLAVPAAILGSLGYVSRRGDRQFAESAARQQFRP